MKVLVVNAGSSSLKYQLLDTDNNTVMAKGICERIGIDGRVEHKQLGHEKLKMDRQMPTHAEAVKVVVELLTDKTIGCIKNLSEIEAIGHRIAHGGSCFSQSVLVTPEVIKNLETCTDIAPLHTPAHLMGIEGCLKVMPKVPQVLVFDTSFHQTMPIEAYYYPIPYKLAQKYGIRRYGFHGTSHKFVAQEMCKILGRTKDTKIITCHLGNGSSIAAIKDGKSIDTSMGFTPLDGIEMGTRCGSIDPAIVTFLMAKEKLTPAQMDEIMNKESGFLGVSELSSDSRDIEDAIDKGDKGQAWLAANVLSYQIKKYIGAYTAAMDGLDAIVFTAGMGENNPQLRERVCTDMDYFGIEIDREINATAHHQPDIVELSTPRSKVKVYLIPTDEEFMIASDTEKIIKKSIKEATEKKQK